MLGVRDSSKTYEKVVSHEVVPESDLNVRQDEKQRSRKQLREEANRKLSTIVKVLKTGYEILRNHCSLPDAYLQFFLPI